MTRGLNVADLWREAFQEATRAELTGTGVKNVSLHQLEFIGNENDFCAAVKQQDLTGLGVPLTNDAKHNKLLNDVLHVIYQQAVPSDHLTNAQSINFLIWTICRQILKASSDLPALANKTTKLVRQVISFVDRRRRELSLYTHYSGIKHLIVALFTDLIILSAIAETHAHVRHRWWERPFRASVSSAVDPYLLKLHSSLEHLDLALVGAAARARLHDHDAVQHRLLSLPKQTAKPGHRYSSVRVSGAGLAHLGNTYIDNRKTVINQMSSSSGEPSLSSWLLAKNVEKIPEPQRVAIVPGTCTWLLQTSKWLDWIQRISPAPLILTGLQGSGKSTLAQFACSKLDKTFSRPVLSYSFDATLALDSCKAQTFLISVLIQLYLGRCASSKRATSAILEQHRPSYPSIWNCPYQTLLKIVRQVLDEIPSYYLIVDGLDENVSGAEEEDSLHGLLIELASRRDVAVLITCRTNASSALLDHKTLNLQSYQKQLHADLACFVQNEVNTKLQLKESRLKREVIETATRSATFLHAKLFITSLEHETTPGQIRAKMNSMGREQSGDLCKKYEQLLKDSENKLSVEQLARQKWILQLIVAARQPLSLDQIAECLAINQATGHRSEDDESLDIAREVEKLCGCFVSISDLGQIRFFHKTAKTFFESHPATTRDASNLYLALKCLAVLNQDEYASIGKATESLRRHYPLPSDNVKESTDVPLNSSIYKYAALYFQEHVTAVARPPKELLSKLSQFLQGTQFVTWSEMVLDFRPGTGYAAQIDVRASLSGWIQTLPPADQNEIKFIDYLEAPYLRVSERLEDTAKDKILQFLPRIRFGSFLNEAGESTSDWEKAYVQKQIVYDGLSSILPPEEPFLLTARTSLLREYFWQKRFEEVLPELFDVYRLQRDLGEQAGDGIFSTAWLIGAVWIALGDYNKAGTILSETLEQVRQLKGEKDILFDTLLLLEGQLLERVNNLDGAAANYNAALSTRTEIAGRQNIFVLMLKTAIGVILRKQGKYEKAEPLLLEGWAGRRKVSSINVNVCYDEAMQLAALYRDKGNAVECRLLLNAIKDSTVRQEDFERNCQFIHIDSLLAFDSLDRDEYNRAKYTLMQLIDSATGKGRARNNRELLWVRIDLADAMRLHDESDEALMLFTELVMASSLTETTEIQEEPESPKQLETAEKALRYVRNAQYDESKRLLGQNNLKWLREADFYFSIQGGPTLDTSIVRPVRAPRMKSVRIGAAS